MSKICHIKILLGLASQKFLSQLSLGNKKKEYSNLITNQGFLKDFLLESVTTFLRCLFSQKLKPTKYFIYFLNKKVKQFLCKLLKKSILVTLDLYTLSYVRRRTNLKLKNDSFILAFL